MLASMLGIAPPAIAPNWYLRTHRTPRTGTQREPPADARPADLSRHSTPNADATLHDRLQIRPHCVRAKHQHRSKRSRRPSARVQSVNACVSVWSECDLRLCRSGNRCVVRTSDGHVN